MRHLIRSQHYVRIKLEKRTNVFSWRETLFILLVAVPFEYKVCHIDMIVPKICLQKVIRNTVGHNLIYSDINDMALSRYYNDSL